ncbi:hypothetical protein PtB15_6B843 [Puccinia triticina]|nr:hypothetical protein PtB15_6B843 [Puccinia triticina]
MDKAIIPKNSQAGSPTSERSHKRVRLVAINSSPESCSQHLEIKQLGSLSDSEARMKWRPIPSYSHEKLKDVFSILRLRGITRDQATKEPGGPYDAVVAQQAVNARKNRSVFSSVLFFPFVILLGKSSNHYTLSCASSDSGQRLKIDADILPYDANRYHLDNPIQENDYINASWISEPAFELPDSLLSQLPDSQPPQPQTWIASQGPLDRTCYEFWRIFLHPDVARRPKVIIQLTAFEERSAVKCARYKPDEEESPREFSPYRTVKPDPSPSNPNPRWDWAPPDQAQMSALGRIQVTLQSKQLGPVPRDGSGSFYRKNKLLVELLPAQDEQNQQGIQPILQKAIVTHYECTGWHDHGTPDSVEPILELIDSAKADSKISGPEDSAQSTSPILVHCSAGVGRTGTLIAIASCNAQLAHLRSYNLPDHVLQNIISHLGPPRLVLEPRRIPALPAELNGDLVARTVDFLREQRVIMVQTPGQLDFVYKAVAHFSASLS